MIISGFQVSSPRGPIFVLFGKEFSYLKRNPIMTSYLENIHQLV